MSAVLFLVFLKIIFLLNKDKKESNFNTWGKICDSELVLEAAKVEQKIRKTTIKTNRPQFFMVYTLVDRRNDAIKCSKLCSATRGSS